MYSIKAYTGQIAPIGADGVKQIHFKAIHGTIAALSYLNKLLGGRLDCSHCGTAQYPDQILLDRPLSKATCQWIEGHFPFIYVFEAMNMPDRNHYLKSKLN